MDAGSEFQRSTLQRYLKRAGYRNAIFGKYLNRWDMSVDPPYFHKWAIIGGLDYYGMSGNVGGEPRTITGYNTDYITRKAVRFVRHQEREDERPWFMYLAVKAPHAPYTPSLEYEGAAVPRWGGNPAVFESDRSDKPPFLQARSSTYEQANGIRTKQLRTLMSVDDLADEVFRVMATAQEQRDTLALYISDNGYLWGEHGANRKLLPYIPSVRIPFLLRWPEHLDAGVKDDRTVATIDVAPTIYAAAGITPRHVVDGTSVLGSRARQRLLLEYYAQPFGAFEWASTVTDDYQYTEYYGLDGYSEFREYYDLNSDPWQLENIFGDADPGNDPEAATLSAQLAADRACRGTVGPAACP